MPGAATVVITDSSASMPADAPGRSLVRVIPLRLLAGGIAADDDGGPAAAAVLARGGRVTTARPTPGRFAEAYRAAAAAGYAAAVCVHLSGLLSGTAESALVAARESPIPVRVVDAGTIGAGLGLAVLEAARAAHDGASPGEVAAEAARHAAGTATFLALDGLGALHAGGRLAAGLAGPAAGPAGLVYRPILRIRDGRLVPAGRVRTRAAAAERLAELAAGFAGDRAVDVAVEHTDVPGRAASLLGCVAAAIPRARREFVVAAGGAIVAHAGTRMVGVTVAPATEGR